MDQFEYGTREIKEKILEQFKEVFDLADYEVNILEAMIDESMRPRPSGLAQMEARKENVRQLSARNDYLITRLKLKKYEEEAKRDSLYYTEYGKASRLGLPDATARESRVQDNPALKELNSKCAKMDICIGYLFRLTDRLKEIMQI